MTVQDATPAAQAIALTWTTTQTGAAVTTFAHLGWVDLGGTEWTIHANVDPDRYAKYADNPKLAAHPDVFRAPGVNLLSYPVTAATDHAARLLFHAPAFLAERFPQMVPALGWKPRVLASGHTIHEATVATIEDMSGPFPVIARVDRVLIDLNGGDLNSMTEFLGEGTDRRMVVPVPSIDATATDVFNQLADSRSRH